MISSDRTMTPLWVGLCIWGSVWASEPKNSTTIEFDNHCQFRRFRFSEILFDDVLEEPLSLALSPHGETLYAVGHKGKMAVFDRNLESGSLSYVQSVSDGVYFSTGCINAVSVSPDGRHVYIVDSDGAVVTFGRDQWSGKLRFGQILELAPQLAASHVCTSPDGKFVYTANQECELNAYCRDPDTGELSLAESHRHQACEPGNARVTVSPDGATVILASGWGGAHPIPAGGQVAVYRRHPDTSELGLVQILTDGVDGMEGLSTASYLAFSADGNFVYLTSTADRALSVFYRDPVSGKLVLVQQLWHGEDGVEGLDGAESVSVSPDGLNVYVTGYEQDQLTIFRREPLTGALAFSVCLRHEVDGIEGLDGPRSVIVSPGGEHVYVANAQDDAIAMFVREPLRGDLHFVYSDRGETSVDGLEGAESLELSPDGRHLYVCGYDEDAIAVFGRSRMDGSLVFLQAVKNVYKPSHLAISPDGSHVYVVQHFGHAMMIFHRDIQSGELEYAGVQNDLNWPDTVMLSPDGLSVFVGVYYGLLDFSRDPASGALTQRRTYAGGEGAPLGRGPSFLTMSPDGTSLYAIVTPGSGGRHDLVVLGRDPSTAELSLVQIVDDSNHLVHSRSVDVSPDGKTVYVACTSDTGALLVYSRDPFTGELTLSQEMEGDEAGLDGLFFASSINVSPNGRFVVVGGGAWPTYTLTMFCRDSLTGRIQGRQVLEQGGYAVDGLFVIHRSSSVAISLDSRSVYVAAPVQNAVAVFTVQDPMRPQ